MRKRDTYEPKPFDFFKFGRVSELLLKSLRDSTIWCARPDSLNDPFDCQIDLRASFSRAIAKASGMRKRRLERVRSNDRFFDDCEKLFNQVGVCSFSHSLYNALMWSHYADNHKGVCLLYRFSEAFLTTPVSKILGVDRVRYERDALTDWLTTKAPTDLYSLGIELTKRYLTAKAPDWSYETESRIVRQTAGTFAIPPDCLVQVCFGMRTPEDDITRVIEAVRMHDYNTIFCRVVRDPDNDFGISAIEL